MFTNGVDTDKPLTSIRKNHGAALDPVLQRESVPDLTNGTISKLESINRLPNKSIESANFDI